MIILTKQSNNLYNLISKSIESDNTQYERKLEKKRKTNLSRTAQQEIKILIDRDEVERYHQDRRLFEERKSQDKEIEDQEHDNLLQIRQVKTLQARLQIQEETQKRTSQCHQYEI
jgi:hypothetical protein